MIRIAREESRATANTARPSLTTASARTFTAIALETRKCVTVAVRREAIIITVKTPDQLRL